jgi:adenylosuccinate synthase
MDWPDLDPDVLARCTPVYETLPGWRQPSSSARSEAELPRQFMHYMRFIEDYTQVKIRTISVGPEWEATITSGAA